MGVNTGIYRIIGFSDDYKIAILDTSGEVVPAENIGDVEVIKFIPSELTRSEGDWIADGCWANNHDYGRRTLEQW